MSETLIYRLRYPAPLVFLLGGALGLAINLGLSAALYYWAALNPIVAFCCGTVANQLFHYAYYHLVFFNQEIRMKMTFGLRFLLSILVAAAAAMPFWIFLHVLHLHFVVAVIVTIGLLSVANVVLIRVSTFSSAKLAEVEYRAMGETFYDDQTDVKKVGWFRAWFHRSRFKRLHDFVHEFYRPGMAVADLGCGNCWWNEEHIPVVGADINEPMMRWAKEHNRLVDYRVCTSLGSTPFPDRSFDIVVMSETLEHMLDLPSVLAEVRRILKDDGTFLITVPYDVFLGPFFVLFNVNCLYQGYIKGSSYHRFRCGHVNHFTKTRLRDRLHESGFDLPRVDVVNGLSLYAVARKKLSFNG